MRGQQSGDETLSSYRALTQLGALECVQLADMFFGRPIKRLINEINQKVMYFDTLFMHIEVNTFGGNVDGQIDDEEFFEGTLFWTRQAMWQRLTGTVSRAESAWNSSRDHGRSNGALPSFRKGVWSARAYQAAVSHSCTTTIVAICSHER